MSKKIISIALAVTMVAALFCAGMLTASADEAVHAGDQVKYIFSVAPLNDVGGMTVYSTYDTSKLTYVSSTYVYADGMGAVNDLNAGAVNWNDTFAQGLNTSNTDIFSITFDVIADGDVSGLGLTCNCIELFDIHAIDIPGDFNSLVTARVEVVHNETSEPETDTGDTTTDPDTSSSEAEKVSSVVSEASSVTSSEKKNTPDTSKPNSSTASVVTSSQTASDASSKAASSKASSATNSNSSSAAPVNAVKTAGTVAVITLVIVLMAAAAVVFFSKRKSAE